MRGSKRLAVAVREPNGSIVVHSEPLNRHVYDGFLGKTLFLRGITMLWDALVLGMRTLMFSANVAMGEEEIEFNGPIAWGTIAVSLALGVGIFFVGPLLLVGLVDRFIDSPLLSNVLEGLIRLLFFLIYVWAIGFIPDIRRVFGYHGAEHKTINAYEAGEELTVDAVRKQTTIHPRCGTTFLLIVMVVAIFVFSLLGRPPMVWRILSRILLIPLIAGIAYEFIKFSATRIENPFVRMLLAPGMALQKLTTREPDDSMLEVGLAALMQLLEEEQLLEADDMGEGQPAPSIEALSAVSSEQ